jgi:hypothetical protein
LFCFKRERKEGRKKGREGGRREGGRKEGRKKERKKERKIKKILPPSIFSKLKLTSCAKKKFFKLKKNFFKSTHRAIILIIRKRDVLCNFFFFDMGSHIVQADL